MWIVPSQIVEQAIIMGGGFGPGAEVSRRDGRKKKGGWKVWVTPWEVAEPGMGKIVVATESGQLVLIRWENQRLWPLL